MKKKYPDPYRRSSGKTYYFRIEVDGKRRTISTGESAKERARDEIRKFVDTMSECKAPMLPSASSLSFSEYSRSYFVWKPGQAPECPHASRLVDEGKIIHAQHCLSSRRLLDRVLAAIPDFGMKPMANIRRADIVDLRTRLTSLSIGGAGRISKWT